MDKVMHASNSVEWPTPQHLFDELDAEFEFTLDPCSTHQNAKCAKHYTEEDNGLEQDWTGETVFCNPPYGARQTGTWVKKAANSEATTVMLIPARTDTRWFHEHIYNKAEIRFIKGRIRFVGSTNPAPFPSMIVVFRNTPST